MAKFVFVKVKQMKIGVLKIKCNNPEVFLNHQINMHCNYLIIFSVQNIS